MALPSQANAPGRTLTIDTRSCEDFAAAYKLFSALAYPSAGEDAEREECYLSLYALGVREKIKLSGDKGPIHESVLRTLNSAPQNASARRIKCNARLDKRRAAARVVRPWACDHLPALPHRRVPGVKKFTLNQMISAAFPHISNIQVFLRDVYRPAKLVMHLAIAFDFEVCSMPDEHLDTFNSSTMAERAPDGPFPRKVALRAMDLQERICLDPRFGISRENLLWLNWIE